MNNLSRNATTMSLFDHMGSAEPRKEELCLGAFVLHGFALSDETALLQSARGFGDTLAAHTEQARDQILGHGQLL